MAIQSKVKRCGHIGCSLNTPECCGCEDLRLVSKSYARYVDGTGYIKDTGPNARYHGYCTPCRRQLENLLPGRKRCACGVVTCNLTTNQCCVCLDQRPESMIYYRYEDGKGMVEDFSTRWMHYCPPCRKRCMRLQRVSQNEVASPEQCANPTVSSEICVVSPLASIGQVSPPIPEQNAPNARSSSPSSTIAQAASVSAIVDQVGPQSGETDIAEGSPGQASTAFTDVRDYEIVNLEDLQPHEDIVVNNMRIEKCTATSGRRGQWWTFVWRH